jgi:30S ribosomal protein S31
MGRGDKRTKRGKIFAGSYGKTRPQGKKKNTAANAKSKPETKE